MLTIDEFLELARTRRSIRRFKPDPIPDEYVSKIIEAARWAMSGANSQPWEFVVVKNPETRARIIQLYLEDARASDAVEMTRVPEIRQPLTGLRDTINFKDAPVIIAVVGDPRTLQASFLMGRFLSERWPYIMNMGNTTTMIHLAAAALGLGAEWVSITTTWEGRLKALLGVPDFFSIPQIVPIGYPAYKPASSYRRSVDELVHIDKYDMSRFRSHEEILSYIVNLRKRTSANYKLRPEQK